MYEKDLKVVTITAGAGGITALREDGVPFMLKPPKGDTFQASPIQFWDWVELPPVPGSAEWRNRRNRQVMYDRQVKDAGKGK